MVSVKWLRDNLSRVSVVDGTWALPPFVFDESPYENFCKQRIPGARFWDLDAWSDAEASLAPHNLPTPAQFAQAARGLSNVVVYDQFGLFSAPRLWFTLRHFGLEADVLDGGLPAWIAAGYELASGEDEIEGEVKEYTPQLFKQWRLADVEAWLETKDRTLLDARSEARFDGGPDPRGLRPGHIPGSFNVPFTDLLDANPALASSDPSKNGGPWRGATLKSNDALRAVFENIPLDNGIAVTCGSGLTAATVALALHRLGYDDIALYDGSWLEYAQSSNPVE